jgi:hypothetical protein
MSRCGHVKKKEAQPAWVPDLKPGKYSDGSQLDEVQYLECKLILKPQPFTAAKVFFPIKLKAEALPLKDQVGGYRLLFSHNVQLPLSQAPEDYRTSLGTMARVFPGLAQLKPSDADRVYLVNETIVEEVPLQKEGPPRSRSTR